MRVTIALGVCLFLLLCPLLGAEPLYHVLQKGETVYSVAQSFKVSPEAILSANGITDPTKVKLGQRLVIPQATSAPSPAPKTHVVKKGETLYGIARQYRIEVAELLALNKLGPSAVLKVDQVLLLPGGTVATAKPDPAKPGEKAPVKTPAKIPDKTPDKAPGPGPAFPPLVKTSSRQISPKLALPCAGEARYLDGKIDGIIILCDKGSVSKAVTSGRVVSAGPYRGFGLVAFVEGRGGYIYVYGGNDSLAVKVGDSVSPGMELGKVGFDAREGRPAAYFLVFKDGISLDPASVNP